MNKQKKYTIFSDIIFCIKDKKPLCGKKYSARDGDAYILDITFSIFEFIM